MDLCEESNFKEQQEHTKSSMNGTNKDGVVSCRDVFQFLEPLGRCY